MLPLALLVAGGVALTAGVVVLRSLGPGYRIGRILATTPHVGVGEALGIAAAGEPRYVAISGRIESDEEFEDAAHRPLVYRRTRLEARVGRRWRRFEESVEAVPFQIAEGLDTIAVDVAAIGDGLVVIPRESRGHVRDLAERAPATLPPEAAARATVDQVSSIEHATVLGWPRHGEDGQAVITSGGGRPLVVSTLETPSAMRILARGEQVRPRLAAGFFAVGAVLLALAVIVAVVGATGLAGSLDVPAVLAADPSGLGSPVASALTGDTRSVGQGPGLVGAPGPAILGVLAVAGLSVAATLAYVRVTSGGRSR